MFCNNCGKEINDAAYVCPYCGVRTPVAMQEQHQQQSASQDTNGFAIAGLVLAFFFPLLGLIFSCVGLSRSKTMNDVGRGLSIAGIVVSVIELVLVVIIIIAYVSLIGTMMNAANAAVMPLF